MKLRKGFVSNSSSSSFVIPLKDITGLQLSMIIKHSEVACVLGGYDYEDAWDIEIEGVIVRGKTFMDNFDMQHFLINVVGIDEQLISWEKS